MGAENTLHNEQILDQFTRQAEPFARTPSHSSEESLRSLLENLRPDASDNALDVACGPGIVACALAPLVRQVTGIDLVPAMLDQASQRQAGMGLRNLEWRVGDVTHLPFEDGVFQVVVTRYSFHHFLQPRDVLAEMARVCCAGGRVAVSDATPSAGKNSAYDAMEKLRDPSHTRALPVEELQALAHGLPLRLVHTSGYLLDTVLESLLAASFPPEGNAATIRAMVRDDIGVDRLSIGAYRIGDEVRFRFPVSVVVWEKL